MTTAKNILVIEDDENLWSYVSASLTKNGYRVATTPTGRSGLRMVSSLSPSVILLDLGLPDIDGCDLLTQLRSGSRIPVIVISARTEEKEKVKALDLGADDYITKPFGTEELMARIRTTAVNAPPAGSTRL